MATVRERLLKAAKIRSKIVDIDGEQYVVREISAAGFNRFGELSKSDPVGSTSVLLEECVVDEDGNKALTHEDAAEIAKSARVATKLVAAVMELAGIGEKQPDAS